MLFYETLIVVYDLEIRLWDNAFLWNTHFGIGMFLLQTVFKNLWQYWWKTSFSNAFIDGDNSFRIPYFDELLQQAFS